MDEIIEHMNTFLSTVMKTRVFQELYWYLVRNNFVYPDKVSYYADLRKKRSF